MATQSLIQRIFTTIRLGGTAGPIVASGAGSPEGVLTAPVGSTYHRTNGGADTTLYIKESGAGNTGWIASSNAAGGGGTNDADGGSAASVFNPAAAIDGGTASG